MSFFSLAGILVGSFFFFLLMSVVPYGFGVYGRSVVYVKLVGILVQLAYEKPRIDLVQILENGAVKQNVVLIIGCGRFPQRGLAVYIHPVQCVVKAVDQVGRLVSVVSEMRVAIPTNDLLGAINEPHPYGHAFGIIYFFFESVVHVRQAFSESNSAWPSILLLQTTFWDLFVRALLR
jgi:hypothetical protein